MSTEAVEGTGLPVSADAGIAEAAVFRVSPGYFLRQIYPLDPAGGRTRQLAGGLRAFADACADGGVASVQRVGLRPGSLAVSNQLRGSLRTGAQSIWRTASLCLGLIRAPTRIYRSCRTSLASAASRHAHALC